MIAGGLSQDQLWVGQGLHSVTMTALGPSMTALGTVGCTNTKAGTHPTVCQGGSFPAILRQLGALARTLSSQKNVWHFSIQGKG